MVSKSKGHVLRLSALLHALYSIWNIDEVNEYEVNSPQKGNASVVTDFEGVVDEQTNFDGLIVNVPVSVMAMESAISIVTYSLYQNLIIQDLVVLKFNTAEHPYTTHGFFYHKSKHATTTCC